MQNAVKSRKGWEMSILAYKKVNKEEVKIEAWYTDLWKMIEEISLIKTIDSHLMNDLYQQTILKVIEVPDKDVDKLSLARQFLMKEIEEHEKISTEDWEILLVHWEGFSDPWGEDLEFNEKKELLTSWIDRLDEKEQLVLSLYYEQNLNLKQIGEVIGMTESRACQIKGKALLNLKKKAFQRKKIKSY